MNTAPRQPPTIPRMKAAGSRYRALMLMVSLIFPNLSEDPDQSPDKLPYLIFESKARVKVAIEHDANTFQITEKRQKVFGLDIS